MFLRICYFVLSLEHVPKMNDGTETGTIITLENVEKMGKQGKLVSQSLIKAIGRCTKLKLIFELIKEKKTFWSYAVCTELKLVLSGDFGKDVIISVLSDIKATEIVSALVFLAPEHAEEVISTKRLIPMVKALSHKEAVAFIRHLTSSEDEEQVQKYVTRMKAMPLEQSPMQVYGFGSLD